MYTLLPDQQFDSISSHQGQVYWITGLAGAGKTTIGKCLYHFLKKQKPNVVFLDGDILRAVFGASFSHSPDERFQLAMQYARLCQLLALQGLDVVCATISMFDKCREWNRSNLTHYFEIYLKVPLRELQKRDQKNLYSRALKGEIAHVIGVDLPFEEPKNPDLVIENNGKTTPEALCELIINYLSLEKVK